MISKYIIIKIIYLKNIYNEKTASKLKDFFIEFARITYSITLNTN